MTEFATQTLTDGACRLIVDGDMTIYNALEVKQHLIAAVRSANTLELDLSHVSEMDTAGFQLLVLSKQESQRLERTLRITAHSDAVREIIQFYNMGAFFGDPVVIPAGERQ
jgi:anti-anti-sigma factor